MGLEGFRIGGCLNDCNSLLEMDVMQAVLPLLTPSYMMHAWWLKSLVLTTIVSGTYNKPYASVYDAARR